MEEEKIILAKKHNPTKTTAKEPAPVKTAEGVNAEPMQYYNQQLAAHQPTNPAQKPATFVVNTDGTAPRPKPWNKYLRDADSPAPTSVFCKYHKSKAHATEECRYLQGLLMAKYKNGGIVIECNRITENKNQQQNESIARQYLQDLARAEEINKQNEDPTKRQRTGKAIADVPVVVRQVRMIMGGLQNCNDSVRSIKQYRKKAEMAKAWSSTSGPLVEHKDEPIVFTGDELKGVDTPHNDPLVVELIVGTAA